MLPPGEWSLAIVGDQWVDDPDLTALLHGRTNRGNIKAGFTNYGDVLRSAQTGPLADQHGITADDLRDAFRQGEQQARQVAEKNAIKEGAYGTAYDSMVSLRQDLTSLAAEGNQRIDEIKHSKQPVEAKVPQMIAAIHQYRALAAITAAKYSGNVFDAMQRILDAEGTGQSARQFAQAHGVNVGQMFRPPEDQQTLEDQVRRSVGNPGAPPALPQQGAIPTTDVGTNGPEPPAFNQQGATPPSHVIAASNPGGPTLPPAQPPASGLQGRVPPALNSTGAAPVQGGGALGSAPAIPTATPSVARPGMPSVGGAPSAGVPASSVSPLTGAPTAPASPVQPVTPADLMHSFDKGMQAGTPVSATAGAMPPAQPPEPQAPPTTPTSGMSSVPVNTPAYDAPAPVAHAATPDATPAPQVVAGPSAAAAPSAPAPAGPLPAYASDIRPTIPAASAPVLPSSSPPSAMASSAPVHPSAGQGTPAGPTMVRQTPPPAPPSSPSSLGTETVAATATGAIAGAASANATERARLERLVAAVARQQPRLAWAAGDRPDETTVLTTDLASGWIPPGIDLPAAVTLLSPERRRGDIETLLGEVTLAAGYTPIHHVAEEDEPVPTSPRPRRLPDIDELGWELNQATQWRDGLPRLAHTLAKAATGGTGVLEKEVELLQTHLKEVSTRVLESYPENVDFHEVGNWQLLAAIDALVAGDKSSANYHLAWFQACSTTMSQ
ncbi:hypothetical protein MSTO_03240 [Mycobacterium stomatepiae]|uniref:Transmembrane protein n=2 Tax=Mycobacterium stomatepiae TaxID=470076 RepID=A0A7I7Q1M8_9MYCO|nr:hypothetical protein MSTO_03240 [Mycobacterium stomatepiae]